MNRIRLDTRILAAAGLALIAGLATLAWTDPGERVQALVASEPLAPGIRIGELALETRSLPPFSGLLTEADLDDLTDRTLAIAVPEGSPLLAAMVAHSDSTADAMALTLGPEHSVQGRLSPGDTIDIYATEMGVTRLLAERVPILDVSADDAGFAGADTELVIAVDAPLVAALLESIYSSEIDVVRRSP